MKRKRTLIEFKPVCGFDGDDFAMNYKTIHIFYRLNGQKYRRCFRKKINLTALKYHSKLAAKFLWSEFKSELNIAG